MRVDLAPASDLVARLGHPQRGYRSIHVAGTKGKGSVAALVAEGLRRCGGPAVGIYASPHVERIEERIRFDGTPIESEALARALEAALGAREDALRERSPGRDATWFDVLTAAAFLAFRTGGIEWALVECGLGGRLDSTNVLLPVLCVVTSIDLEHTAILGSTRAAIAAEKAGILEPGVPVICGVGPPGDPAADAIRERAEALGAPFHRVPEAEAGHLEERNVALAGAALEVLASRFPELSREGRPAGRWLLDGPTRAAARLPGRGERREAGGVTVVLDGAHVATSLAAVLREVEADSRLIGPCAAVLALGKDKDAPGLLKVLAGHVDSLLCTSAGAGPYRAPEDLAAEARRVGMVATAVADPVEAFRLALESVRDAGWVLVTGSLHLVGAVRCRTQDLPHAHDRL